MIPEARPTRDETSAAFQGPESALIIANGTRKAVIPISVDERRSVFLSSPLASYKERRALRAPLRAYFRALVDFFRGFRESMRAFGGPLDDHCAPGGMAFEQRAKAAARFGGFQDSGVTHVGCSVNPVFPPGFDACYWGRLPDGPNNGPIFVVNHGVGEGGG